MSDNGYDRVVKNFAKFLIDKSENGNVSVSNIPGYVKEWCDEMHEQTKLERERINGIIHSFCRGNMMLGKGCVRCPIVELDVCGEQKGGKIVPLERLREAEKVIGEVVANG